jgi:hypothetical protein
MKYAFIITMLIMVVSCKTTSKAIKACTGKTEVLILTGSSSSANGGFHFTNIKGDTTFSCLNHPDSCYVGSKLKVLYPDEGGPELRPEFSGKKFMVTYVITGRDSAEDDAKGKGVMASVTKMVLFK